MSRERRHVCGKQRYMSHGQEHVCGKLEWVRRRKGSLYLAVTIEKCIKGGAPSVSYPIAIHTIFLDYLFPALSPALIAVHTLIYLLRV